MNSLLSAVSRVPPEILYSILLYTDVSATCSASLVCKKWWGSSVLVLYRKLDLRWDSLTVFRLARSFSNNPSLARYVRSATIAVPSVIEDGDPPEEGVVEPIIKTRRPQVCSTQNPERLNRKLDRGFGKSVERLIEDRIVHYCSYEELARSKEEFESSIPLVWTSVQQAFQSLFCFIGSLPRLSTLSLAFEGRVKGYAYIDPLVIFGTMETLRNLTRLDVSGQAYETMWDITRFACHNTTGITSSNTEFLCHYPTFGKLNSRRMETQSQLSSISIPISYIISQHNTEYYHLTLPPTVRSVTLDTRHIDTRVVPNLIHLTSEYVCCPFKSTVHLPHVQDITLSCGPGKGFLSSIPNYTLLGILIRNVLSKKLKRLLIVNWWPGTHELLVEGSQQVFHFLDVDCVAIVSCYPDGQRLKHLQLPPKKRGPVYGCIWSCDCGMGCRGLPLYEGN